MKTAIIAACLIMVGCAPAERNFWYPVERLQAICPGYGFDVLRMTNSVTWRSWPYFYEPAKRTEITLGSACSLISIEQYPKHKYRVESKLTPFQQENIVEGL